MSTNPTSRRVAWSIADDPQAYLLNVDGCFNEIGSLFDEAASARRPFALELVYPAINAAVDFAVGRSTIG
jgi:hypothetical protein